MTLKQRLFVAMYSRLDQVKSFKSCLPHILLGPLLNTLSHLFDIVRDLTPG